MERLEAPQNPADPSSEAPDCQEEMKFAICDDDQVQLEYLASLVREWAKANSAPADISCYPSAEAFLFAYEDDSSLDVLILDIQMGKMDGVSLAREIRKRNKAVQIVFATGYAEYIADGYEVEALHFLVKPTDREKLFSVLARARDKLALAEKALWVVSEGANTRIPLAEIRAVEVMGNYATIHAAEEVRTKKTLQAIDAELDERFVRVGRSFIVNLAFVRRVAKDAAEVEGGLTVPLARGMYERLNRAIIELG